MKNNLLKWLVQRELAEYELIFGEGEEGSWLDKIDSRYNWLKRQLIEFEERLGNMFPQDWEMSERIAVEFCDQTRKQLERAMFKRRHEIDTKLLLHGIQRTANFESLLSRRFVGVTLPQYQENRKKQQQMEDESTNPFDEPIDDPNNPFFDEQGQDGSNDKKDNFATESAMAENPFSGIISRAFEPYLSIYIESQDRNLADLVERAAMEQKNRGSAKMAVEGSAVLHSCGGERRGKERPSVIIMFFPRRRSPVWPLYNTMQFLFQTSSCSTKSAWSNARNCPPATPSLPLRTCLRNISGSMPRRSS